MIASTRALSLSAGAIVLAMVRPAGAQEVDPAQVQDLYAHSLKVAEETRRRLPRSSKPIFDLGRVHQRFGLDDRALEVFREGLKVDPAHPEVLKEIGFILSQRNNMAEAIAAYREALRIDPTVPEAHARIGLILVHQGRQAQAVEELRAEIDNRTADAMAYLTLGQALRDLGKHQEALRSFREAVRLDPRERRAHYGLAQTCQALGHAAEEARARAEFLKLREKEEETSQATSKKGANREELLRNAALTYLDAGETYLQAELKDEAERTLRATVRFDPRQYGAWKLLVDLLRRGGRTDEALACAREFASQGRPPDALYLLAGLSTEKGEFPQAAQLLEEAIQKQPRDAHAHRELARLILREKARGDPGRALALARRAVDLEPIAMNYEVLGWSLFKNGDVKGSIEAAALAVRLDPGNPAYRQRLAELRKRAE